MLKEKVFCVFLFFHCLAFGGESPELVEKIIETHKLTSEQSLRLYEILVKTPGLTRNIFSEDPHEIRGPNNSWHPASRQECKTKVLDTGFIQPNQDFINKCQSPWMSPIPKNKGGSIESAQVCIDQFEFPNIPCEYPVVWVPASAAKLICESMGKRVCNSDEWESGCAGYFDEVSDPYLFELNSLESRRSQVNSNREVVWSFDFLRTQLNEGTEIKSEDICGIYNSKDADFSPLIKNEINKLYAPNGKSKTCHQQGSDYKSCGTNSWPSGFKHLCRSSLDVYDMHGNLAEVVNFPTQTSERAQVIDMLPGGITKTKTDKTERKGSFFVTRDKKRYPDDCRVRQPYEHFKEFATDKHSYYQEGFRCCKDVKLAP